jgi:murein DD-endopeptidase MepM/ murein hydrolase activator NlpD
MTSIIIALMAALSFVVEVEPRQLTPGEPLRVTVRGIGSGATLSGSFLDQRLQFLDVDAGTSWVAFTGADLTIEPGVYPLRVELQRAGESPLTKVVEIRVEPKEFPIERLNVAPEYVEPPPEVQKRIARESAMLKKLWGSATPERLFGDEVKRPLPDVAGRNFGRRRIFNGKPRSPHSGIDLSAPPGTRVEAAAAGRVVLAQELYFSGNLVVLDHGGGVYTLYAHLLDIAVEAGEEVVAGAPVGRVGATGRVTGPHLHWGARIGRARVDPSSLLELLTF